MITLNYQGIEHQMVFVDLDDPPRWFLDISPMGRVPVLRVDGKTVIFESAVINEYLDDVTPPSLHPADPLERALNRAGCRSVEHVDRCTACEPKVFFSHRRDGGVTGRQGVVAYIR